MPQTRPRAEAFIWQGNPRKFPDMNSYVAHESQYIYWATKQHCDEIWRGATAYIWRARNAGPSGIIAKGVVEELPRQYFPTKSATMPQFRHPERLGFGEQAASTEWKTGISISEVGLSEQAGMLTKEMLEAVCPNLLILRMPRLTVYRVDQEQCQRIEALWARTRPVRIVGTTR